MALLVVSSCTRSTPPTIHAATASEPVISQPVKREVRVTGTVQAVHSFKVLVPVMTGQFNNMTLTRLIPNGIHVKAGDLIATFDATPQIDAARDAQGKFDDLGHQVEQKKAQNAADTAKRTADLSQAEADFAKAQLELQKGPILSEIDRLKAEVKVQSARASVESLKKSHAFQEKAAAAALRILELQRDRQKVAMERAQTNIQKLEIHAPLAGMVAHETIWRGNTAGKPQEGDQLYRNQPLVSIFDPSEMMVRCAVGEPDGAALVPGLRATVYLDAYPDLALPAHFEFASPVASSGFATQIKSFAAVFRIDKTDSHLLPDLSAAVVIGSTASGSPAKGDSK
jgi:HlyD family secretion protein